MRHATVVREVLDRPDEDHDEVEVRGGAGEKSGRHPSRQRARRCVLRPHDAGEKRSGERVGQSVHGNRIAAVPADPMTANEPANPL